MKQQANWRDVLATQVKLLGTTGRYHHIHVVIVAAALGLIAAINAKIPVIHVSGRDDGTSSVALEWFAAPDFGLTDAPGLLGLVLAYVGANFMAVSRALAMWSGEGPEHRGYHWSLPIARYQHDLLRVAAGAMGLMASVAIIFAGTLAGLLMSGRVVTITSMSLVGWLAAFLCPLVIYLIASIAPMMSDRPGKRIATALLVSFGPLLLFALIGFDPGFNFLDTLYRGAFSHSALLTNGFFPSFLPVDNRPGPGDWLIVATLWLALSAAAITLAAWKTKPR